MRAISTQACGSSASWSRRPKEDLAKHQLSRRTALDRREAASSVAPVFQTNTNATCVLASRRPAHPCDERRSAKPSTGIPTEGDSRRERPEPCSVRIENGVAATPTSDEVFAL